MGLQAIGCVVLAVIFLPAATEGASLSNTSHVMFSVFTVLFAVGLGVVARGLFRGLSWPRTATVVWLVVLLPLGWAMVQAGQGLVGVVILGSAVVGIGAVAAESRNAARS
jgi:Na+-driven multidrug efflux pump